MIDGEKMEYDLANSDVLKKDLKKIVGHVRPYRPYIGIITDGIMVARYV